MAEKHSGWVGVDLDGTLCHFDSWQKNCWELGTPYPRMVARVRALVIASIPVRIFTARVAATGIENGLGQVDDQEFADRQRAMIDAWCLKHVGQAFPVTATKDLFLLELWDDRAMAVRDGELCTAHQLRECSLYGHADRYVGAENVASRRCHLDNLADLVRRLGS